MGKITELPKLFGLDLRGQLHGQAKREGKGKKEGGSVFSLYCMY